MPQGPDKCGLLAVLSVLLTRRSCRQGRWRAECMATSTDYVHQKHTIPERRDCHFETQHIAPSASLLVLSYLTGNQNGGAHGYARVG